MAGVTTSSFSIAPGISDFTINTTTPEFPLGSLMTNSTGGPNAYDKTTGSDSGNFQMWAGLPTCTQLGTYPLGTLITDYDCLIYVTFNPTAPGVRQSQLVVTTGPSKVSPTGNVYYFSLSGVGSGGQLVIDGGASTPVAATGLGTTSSVAVTQSGTVYIADSDNNRIVVEPAGGAAQTAIGPVMTLPASVTPASLSGPKGVAVDSTGNVYISDTGNNRILKVDASSGATSVLGNYVWIPGNPATAPPQYAFKAPQGLAVDSWNNVYVADTGNSVVVEIPSNYQLGGAVPLLAYPGAPKFSNPVAIAVDPQGNIYVADTKIAGGVIVMLPPGGGDLVNVPGTQFKIPINQTGLGAPNGVAVDAAGNIYASDGSKNKVVVIPSGPGSNPYTVNFSTLNAPAGLALDASGNLYVADSGDKQVLFSNRQTPLVDFGNVPQNQANPVQPLCAGTIMSDGFNTGNNSPCVLTVTNIGDQSVTLTAPVTAVVGAGNAAYSLSDNCATVVAGGPLPSGIACTIKPTFNPTVDNAQTESVTINGGPQALSLTANGEQPQANIVLSAAYTGGSVAAAGATATITATVTQPHIPGNTPSGTVTFIYTIDAKNQNVNNCGAGGTQTATLNASGIASFNLPTLVQGVQYTISANYNGDLLNSATQAVPYLVSVPGIPVTATVTSTPAQLTFIYGGAPPVVSGTLTPIPPSPITFKFGSAALATTPAKTTYGVTVTFSGAGACAYGFPASNYANGSPALVTENPAPLSYVLPNFTAQYGAPDLGYGANAVITGAVNGDTFIPSFTPPQSSILAVGPYTVVATLTGGSSDNYIVTAPPATLIVTQAPTALSITAAKTQVLNTTSGVASATFGISVGTLVIAGKGTPSGTVTLTDVFTPINTTGLGTAQAPITTVLPLVGAFVQYTPTNTAIGLHQYSFAYSGDADFQSTSIAPSSTAIPCAASAPSANCLVVDNPDFTLTSATGPVIIVPGVVPSQNGLLALPNQNASFPESAVLFVNAVLGFTGQVTLDCKTQNPSYVSCFVAPQTVCFATTSSSVCTNTALTAATVLAVQTPATLPLGFKFGSAQLRTSATRTVLAFLPFGVLAFCLRRRRRLSRALWMLMVVSAVGAGMSGCGGNQVAFYTPVPTGPQIVTVTATYVGNGASQPAGTRQFVVPIAID
jgi:sugar lactone lactonase YvrE